MDENQRLLEEYKETNALHRHQCVLMFAELTVFLVASGTLFNAVVSSRNLIVFVAPIGLVFAVCFYIIYSRAASNSHALFEHAKVLENKLGFSAHLSCPEANPKWCTAINAAKFIFFIVGLFWFHVFIFYKILLCLHGCAKFN